jgi:hypothetical protein
MDKTDDFLDGLLNPPSGPRPDPYRGVAVITAPAAEGDLYPGSNASYELEWRELWHRELGEWPMPFFDENDNLEPLTKPDRALLAAQGVSEEDWLATMATVQGRRAFIEARTAATSHRMREKIEAGHFKHLGMFPSDVDPSIPFDEVRAKHWAETGELK